MKSRQSHRVLIAHPERQHSHQFAVGLNENDLLGLYLHGSALPADVFDAIPGKLRRFVRWFQPIRRVLPLLSTRKTNVQIFNAMLRYYDWSLARRLPTLDCTAVIGYERSSMHTFMAAKRLGMACILDAASVHHTMQSRWIADSNDENLAAVKDREIELADMILTCSSLARQSYIDAGVPASIVQMVPLGVDTKMFRREVEPEHDDPGPTIRFCSSGRLIRLKGCDLLARACEELARSGHKFTLSIAASRVGAEPDIVAQLGGFAELVGRVAHNELYKFYSRADVFVFPSRFESFGLVVAEALSCGLPAIVTENVGAKDLIEDGVNGWIVPAGDAAALGERMAWCVENPQAVRAMSGAARKSACGHDWGAYRSDVSACVRDFLDERGANSA